MISKDTPPEAKVVCVVLPDCWIGCDTPNGMPRLKYKAVYTIARIIEAADGRPCVALRETMDAHLDCALFYALNTFEPYVPLPAVIMDCQDLSKITDEIKSEETAW